MLISDEYLKLNQKLHQRMFGGFGMRWVKHVKNLTKKYDTQDVLDYGCGKASLAANLKFPIRCYDPAIPKYSQRPEPADIVICTDVLEHIEPDCLESVLADIRGLTKKAALLVIDTWPAKKTLADGRNAHLIVESQEWWLNKLTLFNVVHREADERELIVEVT